MSRTRLIVVLKAIFVAFAAEGADGQPTIYLSSLDPIPAGNMAVGSDSWIATYFGTGNNPAGYILNSLRLSLSPATGNPSGFTLFLYRGNAVENPANVLRTLTGPDPAAGGIVTFPVGDLTLMPGTYYWFSVTGATPLSAGAYRWNFTHGIFANGDLALSAIFETSRDGVVWPRTPGNTVFQFGVEVTPVPEPASLWILGHSRGAGRLLAAQPSLMGSKGGLSCNRFSLERCHGRAAAWAVRYGS